jgi:hypothetical protein
MMRNSFAILFRVYETGYEANLNKRPLGELAMQLLLSIEASIFMIELSSRRSSLIEYAKFFATHRSRAFE